MENPSKRPVGYKVQKRSLDEIIDFSDLARKLILNVSGAKEIAQIDFENFIEAFFDAIHLELHIIENSSNEITSTAPAAIIENELKIRESCYLGLCNKNPRDIFTLFHELGHFFLGHKRTYTRDELKAHLFSEDSEWQANQFAAEILMPQAVIKSKKLNSPEAIKNEFKVVSDEAASWRYENIVVKRQNGKANATAIAKAFMKSFELNGL